MNQWQSLLERFLRNECTERENKIVYHALRDGLIDDDFRMAIESVMKDKDISQYIEQGQTVSGDILQNIRGLKQTKKNTSTKQGYIIPEWIKIAAAIVITFSLSWFVFHNHTKTDLSLAMNTVTVPAGQTVHLTLSDGSGVWLNSRTTIQYPGTFKNNLREIILDGEAYFEVAHNKQKPFVVHTHNYDIEVLGTEFNVEAYSVSDDFVTALLKGSVKVISASDTSQTLVLQPGTLAKSQDGKIISENITDFNHYRWREGLISFKNVSFNDLMVKFEKCYGIKIIVENKKAKDYMCTGKFRQSDGVDYALRVLQREVKFKFERDEEKQIIYIK